MGLALLAPLLLLHCGGDPNSSGEAAEAPSDPFTTYDPSKVVALVVDSGFDIYHPVFEGKVLAAYTIVCESSNADASGSEEQEAEENATGKGDGEDDLAALVLDDADCRLEEGLTLDKSSSFAELARYRDDWNDGLRSKDPFKNFDMPLWGGGDRKTLERIAEVVSGEDGEFSYHGTATAGLVAFDNDRVQLVLIQRELSDVETAREEYTCIEADQVDKLIRSSRDQEMVRAYVEQPMARLDREIEDVIRQHNVKVVNQSFGALSRKTIELFQKEAGCGDVDLSEVYELLGQLDQRRREWIASQKESPLTDYVTVRAAGNGGMQIDEPRDSRECYEGSNKEVVVGSVNAAGLRSEFSNYGKCVDLYALGEGIVVAAPDGFLSIGSGTSVSTALITRYVTRLPDPGRPAKEVVDALLGALDSQRTLPWDALPAELAWEFDNMTLREEQYGRAQGFAR